MLTPAIAVVVQMKINGKVPAEKDIRDWFE